MDTLRPTPGVAMGFWEEWDVWKEETHLMAVPLKAEWAQLHTPASQSSSLLMTVVLSAGSLPALCHVLYIHQLIRSQEVEIVLHLQDEETEVQGGQATCLKSQTSK